MKKSDIEKALELVEMPDIFNSDINDRYRVLRQVELAYEQLEQAGNDVSVPLRERRFQIAKLVYDTLDATICCDICYLFQGSAEDADFANSIGLDTYKQEIIECAIVLDRYLRKLYPGRFEEASRHTELFPEP